MYTQAPAYWPYEEPPDPVESECGSADDSGSESDELRHAELGHQYGEFGDEERPTTRHQ